MGCTGFCLVGADYIVCVVCIACELFDVVSGFVVYGLLPCACALVYGLDVAWCCWICNNGGLSILVSGLI